MTKPEQPDHADKERQKHGATGAPVVNKRKSTRYVRYDIGVTLRKIGLLDFDFLKYPENSVKLVDISSRGIKVSTNLPLKISNKINITIRFSDFREFQIPATVVYKSSGDNQMYGIKFDRVSNDLANYLLKTQRKLRFT
jgi:PilZ domain